VKFRGNYELLRESFEEEEMKSSLYGLDMLGYTCAAKLKTNRRENEISSKSIKIN